MLHKLGHAVAMMMMFESWAMELDLAGEAFGSVICLRTNSRCSPTALSLYRAAGRALYIDAQPLHAEYLYCDVCFGLAGKMEFGLNSDGKELEMKHVHGLWYMYCVYI